MPIDFNDDDYSEESAELAFQNSPEEPQDAYQETEDIFSGKTQEETLDDEMSEVEKRLEMAQYYRLLLNDSIFDNPPNPEVADRVETEIKGFVRGRMSHLVGVGPGPSSSTFTDEEVSALKELASSEITETLKALVSKLLKKPSIMESKPKAKVVKEPTLKKVQKAVVTTKAMVSHKPTMAPSLKPVVTPKAEVKAEAPAKQKGLKGAKKFEKKYKVVTTNEGKEIKLDITPQARSETAKPAPTPSTRQAIEAASQMAAAAHASAFHTDKHMKNMLTTPTVE
jgi:hypothetical protein